MGAGRWLEKNVALSVAQWGPWLALLLPLLAPASGTPLSPDDSFAPACGGLLGDTPPGGWRLWSNKTSWADNRVPGVGAAAGANATIPCGVGVLLDVGSVRVGVLDIQGALKFRDHPSLPSILLQAAFVLVQGRLIIGTSTAQFSHHAEIRLLPNPNGRAHYGYTARQPADPQHPRDLGHKALAVVGGQLDLHGLPGPTSMPAWTRLGASAQAGDLFITVRGADLAGWKAGHQIVIAPSDFYPDQEDVVGIVAVTKLGNSLWRIDLDSGLNYNHFGDPLGVPDGFGGYIDETAEVALLDRNIVVTGLDEPAPKHLEGGHLIIFFTQTKQIIEGVQFLLMGQQGQLGKYNIHFHLCGDQSNNSVVRKNVMLHSKQRCAVVHGTFNLTLDSNVAYNTSGHCYMVEEGGETGNTFINNLGLRTRSVQVKIPSAADPTQSDESDDMPATFWISNPNNNYINNAAAGSEDLGFWLELRDSVRGLSAGWAKVNSTMPRYVSTVGIFSGNVIHSNQDSGFRFYPNGFNPRFNASPGSWDWWDQPVWTSFGGFTLYKNMGSAMFIHNTDSVTIANSAFADNVWALEADQVPGLNYTGLRFVGQSSNYGNPQDCTAPWSTSCAPVAGCRFPLLPNDLGRSTPWGGANTSLFGLVVFDQSGSLDDASVVTSVSNCTFSAYNDACHLAAGIAVGNRREVFWNAGHNVRGLRFDSKVKTNPVYLFPRALTETDGSYSYSGDVSRYVALRDLDGSLVKAAGGGYVVASNPGILPPSTIKPKCTALPRFNAYACPGTCYRSIVISFTEPTFSPYDTPSDWNHITDGNRTLRDYTSLLVIRLADNLTFAAEGNLRQYGDMGLPDPTLRVFALSLLAGYTYDVILVPPLASPSFVPSNITLQYSDAGGCGQGLTLRLKGPAGAPSSWAVHESDLTAWAACPGNTASLSPAVAPLQFRYVCTPASPVPLLALELLLAPSLPPSAPLLLLPTLQSPAGCGPTTRCGLTATGSKWQYEQSGGELHAPYPGGPAFYNPLFPAQAWPAGPGVLGYEGGWDWGAISTFLQPPNWQNLTVFYFRTTFALANSACYTGLLLDLILRDGLLLYLNNQEILRLNMPQGPVAYDTPALAHPDSTDDNGYIYNTSFFVPLGGANLPYGLVEGVNYLAAEVHLNFDSNDNVAFALRASALLNSSVCHGASKRAEVCDGVDNDGDGLVDVNATTGQLLQRACATACGAGVETCIRGAYQNCTAPPVLLETCNGRDDNCDGLVDNGPGQLDCPNATVCFGAVCRPVQDLTMPKPVWGQNATKWYFFDKGGNVPGSYPAWLNGSVALGAWKTGTGAFGTFPDDPTMKFGTPLASSNSLGKPITTRYFLKSFLLLTLEAKQTYGFAVGVRRADGAVVYYNGQELFRSNMPAGAVKFTTFASGDSSSTDPASDPNSVSYYSQGPSRASGALAVAGTNWLAAELHSASPYAADFVFDLALTRYAIQACSGGGASCVRRPPIDSTLLSTGAAWKYLDASRAPPPPNWFTTAYVDSAWPAGSSPLGSSDFGGSLQTVIKLGSDAKNGRVTYYFRKRVTVPDGACYYNLTLSLLDNDGALVYINGVEAIRHNMPAGNVSLATLALDGGSWDYTVFTLSGGWLRTGNNLIAVELHQSGAGPGAYAFDIGIVGQREGASCKPLPP